MANENIALHLVQYKHLEASINNEGRAKVVAHTSQGGTLTILNLVGDHPKYQEELFIENADKLACFRMMDEHPELLFVDVPNYRAEVVHQSFAYSFFDKLI